ncbi:hypothetical protein NE237_010098 [Protea cynaroides]|uniref:Uncharacterized protein n=1 Tax=Protea cynaroides TaxID=273540 RepID=A0A9Q0R0X3_9MAGN|nr:hypothetical protein NE237_010098 [Protea cynaroides]
MLSIWSISGATDLRFGHSLAFWKAKSKGYNLTKSSELKEVILDLESGFEVGTEILSAFWNQFGFLDSLESSRRQKIARPGKPSVGVLFISEDVKSVLFVVEVLDHELTLLYYCTCGEDRSPLNVTEDLNHYQTTLEHDVRQLATATKSIAAIYMACGVDITKSHGRADVELMWLLSSVTPIVRMKREIIDSFFGHSTCAHVTVLSLKQYLESTRELVE